MPGPGYQDIWKPCPDCTVVVVVVILINRQFFSSTPRYTGCKESHF